jgi:gas vesicle protein
MSKDADSGFFSGFIIGALIGAAIALLYAPQPGTETRRMVKEKAYEARDTLSKAATKVKEAVSARIQHEKE